MIRRLAPLLVVVAPSLAQTVHQVGPGGFAQIDAAIAAALPGDVIEVAAGTWLPFTCNKGVTIAAAPGAAVDIQATGGLSPTTVSFNVPAQQRASLVGLRFRNPDQFFSRLTVVVVGGQVTFEECRVDGMLSNQQPAMEVRGGEVWMRGCTILGNGGGPPASAAFGSGADALRVANATLGAVDCVFRAGPLWLETGFRCGNGITVSASTVHLVRCTAEGSEPTAVFQCAVTPAGHGVEVLAPSSVWIADSTLRGGNGNCGTGGDGIRNGTTTAVVLARDATIAGTGQVANGLPVRGPSTTDALLGLSAAPGPILLGTTHRVDFRTQPLWPVFVLLSFDLQPSPFPAVVELPWVQPAGGALFQLLVADGNGDAPMTFAVPPSPALRWLGAWLHGVSGLQLPAHVMPPVGGIVR